MTEISAHEARSRFSALLDKVSKGEKFTITKHGKSVACLVPVEQIDTTINKLLTLRKGVTLGGIDWKELRDGSR